MKHNLLKSVIISVILLLGVNNAWAYENFNEIWGTYNIGGNDEGAAFSSNKDLGVVSKFTIQAFYLKCKDNWGANRTCWNGGALYYEVNGGGFTEVINTATDWKPSGWAEAEYQFKRENMNLTLATNSGKYTVKFYGKVWGNKDTYLSNNENNYKWTFTINPPDITNIQVNATGHIAGSGTVDAPYIVAYGASLNLTALVTNSDANSNTHYKFGDGSYSKTNTHTINNITSINVQTLKITAQNINKSDNTLKGTSKEQYIYYKYSPIYLYINGESHLINNTTKQVTVALNRNANDETYTFKVHDDNSHWLGNSGTMERGGASVHSGGWTMSVDDKNDCKLKADLTGDYTFTFIPAGNKVTVTYPQKSYFITGSWDDWAGTAPAFVDASTPVSIHLTGDKVYNFKIANLTETASWYGNEGEMQRTNCTAWTMETAKNDCRIYADLSGNYTFTFNQSTKKLTVTYPTAYKMTYGINNAKYGTVKAEVNYKSVESGEYWYPNTEFTFSYELTKGTLFKGWYDNTAGTGEPLSTDPIYIHTLGADANVYAVCDDGYKITIGSVSYYFVDHNGQQLNSILIDLKQNTSFNAPLYKGETKTDTGNGNYTAPVTGTYTCTINANKNGVIWTPPYEVGDYRLLYVDQVVEKGTGADSWKTVIRRTYEHPSDVVKKSATATRDVVSLHIFTKHENPEVILQQYQTVEDKDQWVDIEAHMVNGPLNALPGTAMLPGRKNAGEGSYCDDFVYDDGIEIIKADDTDAGCGVWDFTIVQNGSTATLDLTSNGLKRYTGKYYIRTSSAPGQWTNYQIPENEINESHYASDNFRLNNPNLVENEYFTHYFCKYVDKTKTANVEFVIANEHGKAISKVFTQDAFTEANGDLAGENANVRFAWNQITNTCKRAYIAGSFGGANEFLVVRKNGEDPKVTIQENNNHQMGYFNDNTNWLYYADVLAQPGAKVQVVAKYNEKYQYFMGAESGGSEFEKLIAGDENDKTNYPIRILYEFPEHRFVVAYMPPSTITGDVAIETPVMLIRKNHEAPNQITFSDNSKTITAPLPAYGTITFTEDFLKDKNKSQYERMLYWVSFPFDVQIKDVFGLGEYGTNWIMEFYDGENRSIKGLDTYNTFWEYILDDEYILKAGLGYVLCLNADQVVSYFLDENNPKEELCLYFPSMETVTTEVIKDRGSKAIDLNVLDPRTNSVTSITDHNWHLIGVPSYVNTGEKTQVNNNEFFYKYDATDNTYDPQSSSSYNFMALHSYMVQHGGTITWDKYIAPEAIAAKRDANSTNDSHLLRLELQQNGAYTDQTFVKLQEEDATIYFDMNKDLPKIINTGANIYSIISEEKIQLAGSVMPIEATIIPLGIKLDAAGEYTFAMPDGTDGIVAELIDYQANTTTNLLFNDYTVSLPKGTFENRFALHVQPSKVTTSVEDINTNSNGVKKYLIDGILYMQKDGVLYDAQGRCVR